MTTPLDIEKGLSFGQLLERFKKFKGEAQLKSQEGTNECVYLVTHNELAAGLRYGYGEQPGQPAFSSCLCKRHADGTLELGWRPTYAEMMSSQWSFINRGVRDDVYSESRNIKETGPSGSYRTAGATIA